MAYEIPLMTFTAIAGVDLSAKQFAFVKWSADNTVVACSATTDKPCGVLQNDPLIGQACQVLAIGITMVQVGAGALVAGDSVGTDANGKAIKEIAGTTHAAYTVGQMPVGVAAGSVGTAFISCINPNYLV